MSKRMRPTTTTSERKKSRSSSPHTSHQAKTCYLNGTTSSVATIAVLEGNRDYARHYEASKSTLTLLPDVWAYSIVPFLHIRERAGLRPTCKWCDEQWQIFLARKQLHVPQEVPTIDEAMRIGRILSKQKIYKITII